MFTVTVENMVWRKTESTEFESVHDAYKFMDEQMATEDGMARHLLIKIYEGDRKLTDDELDVVQDEIYLLSIK
jgi:hypothetical protein